MLTGSLGSVPRFLMAVRPIVTANKQQRLIVKPTSGDHSIVRAVAATPSKVE